MGKAIGWMGVILAGGRSRRFGSDKAFALYQGRPFLLHALDVLRDIFGTVAIITNFPEKYGDLPATVLADESPFLGPAGGIVTALRFARDKGSAIFVTACDMPLLSRPTILRLLEEDDGSPLVTFEGEKGIEPLCAFYRPSLLPVLESRLRAGCYDLVSLTNEEIRICRISPNPAEKGSLININTPEEYRSLRG